MSQSSVTDPSLPVMKGSMLEYAMNHFRPPKDCEYPFNMLNISEYLFNILSIRGESRSLSTFGFVGLLDSPFRDVVKHQKDAVLLTQLKELSSKNILRLL